MVKNLLLLVSSGGLVVTARGAADYPVQPVPFTNVRFTEGFWQQRQATNSLVTVPFALQQCETSQRLKNFDLAAETMRRRAGGESHFQNQPATTFPFDDSDVYKAMEGACFNLSVHPEPAQQQQLDGYIARIGAAQEPDGYLYTWRTMHPDSPAHAWINQQRWLNDPELSHELYNLGHLYEAGAAHRAATGETNLLSICLKSAELVWRDFGDGKTRMAPGHEEIEIGLCKLYRVTGDQRYLELAKFFLESRGYDHRPYSQDHLPVAEQREAVGHAVRANYLYSGMADVTALSGDPRYLLALTAIWTNVVSRKLHLTGGCGALAEGEAYGADYELPNNCYNETCAAVAFLFWNERMFLLTGEGNYMDVFERTLYNGFLSGVSLSGDHFFYPNTLEYDGKSKNNVGCAGRAPWFGCACCPPNLMRMLASLGGYVYAVQDTNLFVNLYAASEARVKVAGRPVKLMQTTDYPWDGEVKLVVSPAGPAAFAVCLRIPGWVRGEPLPSDLYRYADPTPAKWLVRVNGKKIASVLTNGYVRIQREWQPGDTVRLSLPMPVRRVAGNEKIEATRGRVALERGPVVYCFEGVDNDGSVANLVLTEAAKVKPVKEKSLNGVVVLDIRDAERGQRTPPGAWVYETVRARAIPYEVWDNRGLSPMQVWLLSESR
ncbi:conserved exported hypothetical protein [Verrucomicrobia bacterium]|nr:conserved exported hypothetical protein [Verrucomicrobiota bacterium]